MATIENLGAAYSKLSAQRTAARESLPRPKHVRSETEEAIPFPRLSAEIKRMEEAQVSRESSHGRGRAIERRQEQFKRMSLEEFAEMLRKVNLTFDVFEIQAKYTIDRESGDFFVEIINQRTGEVIRKIPPYDIPDFVEAVKRGEAVLTDIEV